MYIYYLHIHELVIVYIRRYIFVPVEGMCLYKPIIYNSK